MYIFKMNPTIQEIWREVSSDDNLKNTLNIDEILRNGAQTNGFLLDKTIYQINEEIIDSLREIQYIREEDIESYRLKLKGYRLADELNQLHKGKHTRWVPRYTNAPYLASGGILTNVKFGEDDVIILIKAYGGKFVQYKFNECITFQKMTFEEELAISALS